LTGQKKINKYSELLPIMPKMKTNLFILILISLFCFNNVNAQKKITITGKVVDVNKGPIVNAIVMIDGEKTSSLTDANGEFKVKVKPTAVTIGILTFGNGIIEEAIGGRTEINIKFGTVSTNQVQEVAPGQESVDMGYSHVKKKNTTTNVNKIDGSKKKYASYTNIYDMIQREVSGVKISGTTVVLQGSKDLFGDIPALFVVDGVPTSSIDNISPTSVQSIEVLKGSSAAMYGSRGYGGVILIKTKTQVDQ
jgi:TonB-dependent starch-binding outer membrane protein SusC